MPFGFHAGEPIEPYGTYPSEQRHDEPRTYEGVDGFSGSEWESPDPVQRFTAHIDTIRHDRQAYPTCGDWWTDPWAPGRWQIRVSKMGNWKYEFLVALHELVEMALCKDRGISEKVVTAFDKKYEAYRTQGWPTHQGEPGDAVNSPYRAEHAAAELIERLVAHELGVDWSEYEKAIDAL